MSRRNSITSDNIRNIIFDFGGVLANFDYNIAFRRLAQKSLLTVAEIHERIHHSPEHRAFERGEITGLKFYAFVVEKTHVRMNYQEFFEAWADIFWPEDPMLDLVNALRERYELYLLSNTNEIHYTQFRHVPRLTELIPRCGLSFELGAMKPQVVIFERFLQQFDLRASESIFIDDLAANARGARRAGLHAIHHTSLQSTRRSLARFGITA